MPPIYSKEWTKRVVEAPGSCRQGRTSPCEAACPAGNPTQKLHSLAAEGKASEALDYLRARNPFPGVTGRVCPHPCEERCNRGQYDEALNIRGMERFAADNGRFEPLEPLPPSGKSAAIIGSGPAGLTAAYFLALFGHAVTVFEKAPIAGGTPRQSIPDFRLPKDVLDREVGAILELGIKIHTNVEVGVDIGLREIIDSHDGCIVAVGLGKDRLLDIPGQEYLQPAVSWLRASTLERRRLNGKKVVILGGGGVAMDCAFTARRLQASEVHMVFLEPEDGMAAPAVEVTQARSEDITLHGSCHTREVEKTAQGYKVRAVPIKSFAFQPDGGLKAEEADGPALELDADLVICASGLLPDLSFLQGVEGVELGPRNLIVACAQGGTTHPGLIAAGDITTGPSLVAQAIGQGRKAAIALHKRLCGLPAETGLDIWIDETGLVQLAQSAAGAKPHIVGLNEIWHLDYHEKAERRSAPQMLPDSDSPPHGLNLPFGEIARGLAPETAAEEASRCLHCGHCMACGTCVESCPGHILEMTDDGPRVAYPGQCWHCGCCRIACPTGSIAYAFPLNTLL